MSAKDALKNFTARLLRHFDSLREQGIINDVTHETFSRSVHLQSKDEILRIDGIPTDASPLTKALLEELQAL